MGAPTSQGQQSRINRGGVVYKCSTTSDDGCDEIDFHQERTSNYYYFVLIIKILTHQFLNCALLNFY